VHEPHGFPACRVAVLEGGLPDWTAAGLPLETSAADEAAVKLSRTAAQAPPAAAKYKATLDTSKVRLQLPQWMSPSSAMM
jgi:3-mercaptopyruvate sulfurtransferase SseA